MSPQTSKEIVGSGESGQGWQLTFVSASDKAASFGKNETLDNVFEFKLSGYEVGSSSSLV